MIDRVRGYGFVSLLSLLALLYQTAASAGPVRISPVRIDLDQATRAGVVELTNPGATPISMQVDAVTWRQAADGTDLHEPTDDLLAFPPIFTIDPGESQLVRVGKLMPQSPERESTYRLYFTELPTASVLDDRPMALKMRLRISLPVFSGPLAEVRRELRIVRSEYEGDRLKVVMRNAGNTHIRVSDFFASELVDSERTASVRYILAGSSTEFSLALPAGATVSTVEVVSDELGATVYDLDTGLAVPPAEAELASR